MSSESDDPLMLSALQHWSYCQRQWALIHLEQVFDDNIHTMRGNAAHERVDEPGYSVFENVRSERALPVWSDQLGLVGKCDLVEFHPDGRIYPVEYKHGRRKLHLHDDMQLTAQAICLEEMFGKPVTQGAIYHHKSRRRREVEITTQLRKQVEIAIADIRTMLDSGKIPPPVNDERCKECSLSETCQPKAMTLCSAHTKLEKTLFELED